MQLTLLSSFLFLSDSFFFCFKISTNISNLTINLYNSKLNIYTLNLLCRLQSRKRYVMSHYGRYKLKKNFQEGIEIKETAAHWA